MASNFKRIRFFECDQIEDLGLAKAAAQAKGGKDSKTGGSMIDTASRERTVQDVNVIHMIYLDMFFLFLGTPAPMPGETPMAYPIEYFYLTKNMQIKSEFRIHSQTHYVDKFISYQKGMKLLISMGRDVQALPTGTTEDLGWIVKIWDFQSLV